MAISSSSISTFGSLQPRGNAMSGAVNFIRGKASQSISGVKSKIGGLGSNIGEKIKNISTKPQSNVGERSNVVRDVLQTFGNEKTEKILTKNLKILRDTFVETFEVARLLRASAVGAGGLGAGSGGGGGGLSPLVAGGIGGAIGAALAAFGKRIARWTKNLVKGSVNGLKRILGIPVKPTATTTNLGPRLQSKNIKGTQGIQGTQGSQGIQGKPGKPGATTQTGTSTSTSTTNNISNTRNNTTTTNQNSNIRNTQSNTSTVNNNTTTTNRNNNIRNTQSNTSTASNNITKTNRIKNINNASNVNNIKPRGNIFSNIGPKIKNIMKFGGGGNARTKLLFGATLAAGGLFGINALNKKGDKEGGAGVEGDALNKFDISVDKFGEFVKESTRLKDVPLGLSKDVPLGRLAPGTVLRQGPVLGVAPDDTVPMDVLYRQQERLKKKKPQGFMRAVAGYADWLTLNTFDFDRRGTLLDGIKNIVNPKEVETKIPKTSKKKPNIVMLPGMGAAAVPPQQGQKIVNPNGGVGNSIDYPFLSSSKSDNFGALESKMIYNVVG